MFSLVLCHPVLVLFPATPLHSSTMSRSPLEAFLPGLCDISGAYILLQSGASGYAERGIHCYSQEDGVVITAICLLMGKLRHRRLREVPPST